MARVKIDYGIDLGTTNSAISRMDNGKIVIFKSDRYQKDTTPSCVKCAKKQIIVGDVAFNSYNQEVLKAFQKKTDATHSIFIEFKRTMGTDKTYVSDHTDSVYSSEQLSAEVLKQLKSYVRDENINAAVITVPNQFRQNQVDATQRAAEMAGFQYCELLQEPIAASMAYGIEAKEMHGHWLVFDFGGGTFDAALMKVDEGIMKVVDTAGNNHLGGKDLDLAIVDNILLPYIKENYSIDEILADEKINLLLRAALKVFAEGINISLSSNPKNELFTDEPIGEDDDGEEIELDLTITLDDYEQAVGPIFQKAINIALELLSTNNLKGKDLSSVLLVGGPTFSQTLRRMLQEQLKTKIDTSIDPMTSVAIGAALFASTKNIPIDLQKRDVSKVQLTLKYPETTVETDENLGIRIERSQTTKNIPDVLWIEITRADQGWSSGKVRVEGADIISILLVAGKSNGFDVVVYDEQGNICPCEPANFTIIQGLKAATPTLPKSICIDTILMEESGKQRLVELKGLEKNKTLPAKGKGSFKTQKAIRPGKKEDVLRIPIVEGEPEERSIYNQDAAIIQLTGEDFAEFLPEGSTIELTVSIDSSRRIILEAYFPDCDETIERVVAKFYDTEQKEYDVDSLHREIRKAEHAVNFLDNVEDESLQTELKGMATQLDAAGNDHDAKTKIMEELRVVLKRIDELESKGEWPQAEQKLNDALSRLQITNERYGNAESSTALSQFEAQAQTIKQQLKVKLANDLCEEIGSFDFNLVRQDIGLWVSYLKGFDEDFDNQPWEDKDKDKDKGKVEARQLINEAKHILSTQPSREKIESIVFSLFGLLPDKNQPLIDEKDRELLSR